MGKAGRPVGVKDVGKRNNTEFTTERKNKFLRHLSKHGNVSSAATAVGVSRATIYAAARRDERFKDRLEMAKDKAVSGLEDEMEKRIYQGDEKFEYYVDEDGVERLKKRTVSKDNNLLVRALEANDPDKYGKKTGDKSVVVNAVGDSAISKLAEFLKVDLPDHALPALSDKSNEVEGEFTEESP